MSNVDKRVKIERIIAILAGLNHNRNWIRNSKANKTITSLIKLCKELLE